jgi:Holliday junction DNA helicase RuvA
MIYHISGRLVEATPTYAVIECAGVGYITHISLTTYASLGNQENLKLYTHPVYKEDSQTLYGFFTRQERDIFIRLISVSGVGGNTARVILSSLSPGEVIEAIASEDVSLLKSIKGIGAKTAERIIVDLKDKMGAIDAGAYEIKGSGNLKTEAISALEVLGYNARQSEKLVSSIIRESAAASLEEVLKEALKRL